MVQSLCAEPCITKVTQEPLPAEHPVEREVVLLVLGVANGHHLLERLNQES